MPAHTFVSAYRIKKHFVNRKWYIERSINDVINNWLGYDEENKLTWFDNINRAQFFKTEIEALDNLKEVLK